MKPEDFRLDDWARILSGQAPAGFYLEVVIRSVVVYTLLVCAMRLLGQRMAAQLNPVEQGAVVTLAAAVGVPLMSPDRGLLAALVIAAVMIAIIRLSSRISARGGQAQVAVDGRLSALVIDSVLQLPEMKKSR